MTSRDNGSSLPLAVLLTGVAMWAFVGVDLLLLAESEGGLTADASTLVIAALYVLFGVSFVVLHRYGQKLPLPAVIAFLVALAAFANLYTDLTVLVLLVIPLVLDRRKAVVAGVLLIVVNAVANGLALSGNGAGHIAPHRAALSPEFAVFSEVARVALIQGIALACGLVVAVEREARVALRETNEALLAARAELGRKERAEERARIALELHDGLGHHLAALGLSLELAQKGPDPRAPLGDAQSLVRSMLGDVRGVLRADEPPLELEAALAGLAQGLAGVRVTLRVGAADVPPRIAHAIFRIAQEASTNAVRHGGARHLEVCVERADDAFVLRVSDDGAGFAEAAHGRGIPGMRARAERAGGVFELTSTPGKGTTVRAEFGAT